MGFNENSVGFAEKAMMEIDPSLSDRYKLIINFLQDNPLAASSLKGGKIKTGSEEYIRIQASNYWKSRNPRLPKPPTTRPDEMVSVILEEYFGLPKQRLEEAKREHLLSMAAENIVGDLLERYLAKILEPHGWIWCSGSMVKAVDFIKPSKSNDNPWILLQVKNRDNSENSSSAAIRNGTDIRKWFRSFSKKEGSNWSNFPDETVKDLVSEEGFMDFVRGYLKILKSSK